MSGWLQALAELLGIGPTPGTREHREVLFRSIKERNDELAKPPGRRDEARLLELSKRVLRLRIEAHQVNSSWQQALKCPSLPLVTLRHLAPGRPAPRPRTALAAVATALPLLSTCPLRSSPLTYGASTEICFCSGRSSCCGATQAGCCNTWTSGAAATARVCTSAR